LFVGVVGIWLVEYKTELPTESLVGLFFTSALAIGILITPQPDLLEALFGDITKIGPVDALITIVLTAIMSFIMFQIYRGLTLSIVSKQLAQSMGINVSKINFLFLLLVAIVVALGLKVTGVFLMGALVIVPAAAAKNVSIGLTSFTRLAALFGGVSTLGGILFANYFNLHPGPIVVLTSGVVFMLTLFFKKTSSII